MTAGKPVPSVQEMGSWRALMNIKNIFGDSAPSRRSPLCRRKEDIIAKQPAHESMTRKYAPLLEWSKGQPECLPIITDPEPGVDQQKESIGDGTVHIDMELYEQVDDSDSDIDMGETENKDIMNQDESLMDIDSAACSNRIC